MKNFDFENDFKDWRNFVYKIKLRLNQVEETSEVLGKSFRPLPSVTESTRYVNRPILLTCVSTHPAHQKTQEKDCHGTFTFLHMLIISKNMKFLRYIIHKKKYKFTLQVNLCQKILFLHQLTHNMMTDCSLNYKFNT